MNARTQDLDLKASHHLTHSLEQVHNTSTYQRNEGIVVKYGNQLPMKNVSHEVLHTRNDFSLFVSKLLYAPHAYINLLFV